MSVQRRIYHWLSFATRVVLLLSFILAPVSSVFAPTAFAQGGQQIYLPQINAIDVDADVSKDIDLVRSHQKDEVQLAPVELNGPAAQAQASLTHPDPEWGGVGDVALASVSALPRNASLDMKLLVIAADGNETDYPAITTFLRQIGIPFDEMFAESTPLTASKLWNGTNRGYYYGIILVTGNLTYFNEATNAWESAFDQTEWETLWAYEAMWGVRQMTSYTVPGFFPDQYGMSYDGFVDATATPVFGTLTAAGQQVYPYINAANPIEFKNAWVYLGTPITNTVTPLVTTAEGHALVSINKYPSGRENLAVTVGNNPYLVHSMLLSYGSINWLTKGIFLGDRRTVMNPQVDDLFIDSDMWDTVALTDTTGFLFRMSGDDYMKTIAWQNAMHTTYPLASSVKLEWAFNGEGTTNIWDYQDTLTPAVMKNLQPFNFVNHTMTHANLDFITYAAARQELVLNHRVATDNKITNYFRDSMVQPDISGLYNAQFAQAAKDFGIKYMISDTSRPGWDNPTPNAGFYSQFQPSILIIPRRPSNLFYNLSTPEEWVSEYNCYYGPNAKCADGRWSYWPTDLTYEQIIDKESDVWLTYLLKWDIDPLMFHQANLRAFDGNRSLLSDLIDATLAKYFALVNLPILGMSQHEIGLKMTQRMNYNASGIKGSLIPCKSITLSTTKTALIPITGVSRGTRQENYGGQVTSYLQVNGGKSVTFAAPACN